MKALIVEDDRKIKVEVIDEVFASLRFESDWATNQEDALGLLTTNAYDLILLDLQIPSRPGGKDMAEFGKNLLKQVRARLGRDGVPVVLMTAQHQGCVDLFMDLQEIGIDGTISKPFPTTGRTLAVVIDAALERHRRFRQANAGPREDEPLTPFAGGVLAFHPDHVELCGETIATIGSRGLDWHILEVLRHRTERGKLVSYGGTPLGRRLPGKPMAGAVAKAISTLRHRVIRILRDRLGIACELEDVIKNDGGYRLRDWIVVEVYDEEGRLVSGDAPLPPNSAVATTGEAARLQALNERQRWFIGQLAADKKMVRRDIQHQFGVAERTAKRDVAALAQAGLVVFEESERPGFYRLR